MYSVTVSGIQYSDSGILYITQCSSGKCTLSLLHLFLLHSPATSPLVTITLYSIESGFWPLFFFDHLF